MKPKRPISQLFQEKRRGPNSQRYKIMIGNYLAITRSFKVGPGHNTSSSTKYWNHRSRYRKTTSIRLTRSTFILHSQLLKTQPSPSNLRDAYALKSLYRASLCFRVRVAVRKKSKTFPIICNIANGRIPRIMTYAKHGRRTALAQKLTVKRTPFYQRCCGLLLPRFLRFQSKSTGKQNSTWDSKSSEDSTTRKPDGSVTVKDQFRCK